ncbi:hypothetical protein IU433_24440 [Nocardia puris]|uniref:Uncharacterized protein n=1 Tax=Nocardia puris TaxID=208602 RepID=A0A366DH97_9NOCA|nr:DUF5947 family protein [Nocardia puris]MBF6213284.1 hypothetical protein [Nocardia puris]MBF6369876.1 hypothetical protein [Nocardia puris]MBF6462163.1 hypothetical protein [Nocardia puris]RBO89467.1 hypothetical protein DFR74_107145 [Nocardia puris]
MTRGFGALRRIATGDPPPLAVEERCEMCADPIGAAHSHVVNLEGRQLMCVCRMCYLLFTDQNAELRYRAVPDRYVSFPDCVITQDEWDALQIPVGLAFFFTNSALGRTVVFYPGPAGATESELPLDGWHAILARHPELDILADDVEALLIRMPERGGEGACLLLPIDACYEFVGRMRLLWRGFDGGAEARAYLADFFASMSARARPEVA